jgi:hypothetical protein
MPSSLPVTDVELEEVSRDEPDKSDDSDAEETYGTIPRVSHRILLKNCHLSETEAPGSLQTLRMDDCNIRAASLDVLGELGVQDHRKDETDRTSSSFSPSGAQIRDS